MHCRKTQFVGRVREKKKDAGQENSTLRYRQREQEICRVGKPYFELQMGRTRKIECGETQFRGIDMENKKDAALEN